MSTDTDTKLVTVLEVRYQGAVLYSHTFGSVLNELDLCIHTDIRRVGKK